MNLQLEGKNVFITGSTAGIGYGVAESMLQEGASVIINGRTNQSVGQAVEQLSEKFPEGIISGRRCDFSQVQEVEKLISNMPSVDILINNVGIYTSQSFFDTSDEDWMRLFEVNVMSGVRLSRALLPQMLGQKWGRIIFISSECATLVPQDLIAYSTTKAAILAISRGLAQLTKGTQVTVNTVMPGSTMTEGAGQFIERLALENDVSKAEAESDFFEEVRTSSLLQRFASVKEVADTVTYLSSPLSSATNGAAIKVDGGSMGGII